MLPAQISLVAFGKTPAKKVELRCDFQHNDQQVKKWNGVGSNVPWTFKYILPSRSENISCGILDPTKSLAGEFKSFIIMGVATYEDEVQRQHQTPFCEVVLTDTAQRIVFSQCLIDYGLPELK